MSITVIIIDYIIIGFVVCGLIHRSHQPGHIKTWEWLIAIMVWPLLVLVMTIMIIGKVTERR